MADVLATAVVDILVDDTQIRNIGAAVSKSLTRASNESANALKKVTNELSRVNKKMAELTKAGDRTSRKFKQLSKDAEFLGRKVTRVSQATRRFDRSLQNLDRSQPFEGLLLDLENMETDLRKSGAASKAFRNAMRAAAAEARNDIVNGPLEAIENLDNALENLSRQARASFSRGLLGGSGAGLDDLGRTLTRELNIARRATAQTANTLTTAIPELGRLAGPIRARFDQVFDGAAADVDRILADLRQIDDITPRQLEAGARRIAEVMERADREAKSLRRTLTGLGGLDVGPDVRTGSGRTVDRAADELRRYTREADRAAAATLRLGRNSRHAHGGLLRAATTMRLFASNLRFFGGAVGGFALFRLTQFGFDAAESFEQTSLALRVLARDIEGVSSDPLDEFRGAAEASFKQIQEFAINTPFALNEVADAVRRVNAFLPSFGIATDEQLSTLRGRTEVSLEVFEDLASGLSVLGQPDAIDRLIKGLGDVAAAGRLTGDEMRQIRNAVPGLEVRTAIIEGLLEPTEDGRRAFEELGPEVGNFIRQLGVLDNEGEEITTRVLSNFVDLQAQGLIPTTAVVEGLRNSLRSLAGDDALEAFTRTLSGQIEKIREATQIQFGEAFQGLTPILLEDFDDNIRVISEFVRVFSDGLVRIADSSLPHVRDGVEQFSRVMEELFEDFDRFIRHNGDEFEEFMEAAADAAIALSPVLIDVGEALVEVSIPLAELTENSGPLLSSAIELSSGALSTFLNILNRLPGPLGGAVLIALRFNRAFTALGKALFALPAATRTAIRGLSALSSLSGGSLISVSGTALGAGLIGGLATGVAIDRTQQRNVREKLEQDLQQIFDEVVLELRLTPEISVDRVAAGRQLDEVNRQLADAMEAERRFIEEDLNDFFNEELIEGSRFEGPLTEMAVGVAEGIQNVLSLIHPDIDQTIGPRRHLLEQLRIEAAELRLIASDYELGLNVLRQVLGDQFGLTPSQIDLGKFGISEDDALGFLDGLGLLGEDFNTILSGLESEMDGLSFTEFLHELGGVEADLPAVAEALRATGNEFEAMAVDVENATNKLKGFTEQLAAQTNPVFAFTKAQEDLNKVLGDEESTPGEIVQAGVGLIVARNNLAELEGGVSGSLDLLEQLFSDSELAPIVEQYFDDVEGVFDNNAGIFENADAAAELGKFGELVPNIIREGKDEVIASIEEYYAAASEAFLEEHGKLTTSLARLYEATPIGDGLVSVTSPRTGITAEIPEAIAQIELLDQAVPTIGDVEQAMEGLRSSVVETVAGLGPEGFAAGVPVGEQIGAGLAEGIERAVDRIRQAITTAISGAESAGYDAARIRSPSRRFAEEIGRPIGEGIAVGILESQESMRRAMQGVIGDAAALRTGTSTFRPADLNIPSADLRGVPRAAPQATTTSTNTINAPITINQQPGQSGEDLARRISRELGNLVR